MPQIVPRARPLGVHTFAPGADDYVAGLPLQRRGGQLVHDGREGAWFEDAWRRAGKRFVAGKITIRFRRLDELAWSL